MQYFFSIVIINWQCYVLIVVLFISILHTTYAYKVAVKLLKRTIWNWCYLKAEPFFLLWEKITIYSLKFIQTTETIIVFLSSNFLYK